MSSFGQQSKLQKQPDRSNFLTKAVNVEIDTSVIKGVLIFKPRKVVLSDECKLNPFNMEN